MAFILADPATLARDLWPEGRGRLVRDTSTRATLPASKIVPSEYDTLGNWLCVDPCGVNASCAAWVHPDVAGEAQHSEVTVRLNGFVEAVSLGMLGNWDGTLVGAPKAVQSIMLVGGGCTAAFQPQLNAMDNVKERVLCLLSRGSDVPDVVSTKLILRRRVFQKMGGTENIGAPLPVPVSEDPVGRVRKMQHMWAVTHHIIGGVQQPDGRVTRANPSIIRAGDFVDVAVTIQVVSYRHFRGRQGAEVLFVPQTVVRLCSIEQSAAMLRTIANEDELSDIEERGTVTRRDFGIEFEGDEAEMQT